ncbi:Homeobox domain-containing protein [Mycena kentingensis (nom. inval.)]|nr:Homeobox domain-containing protein [Mycena kentingensis (nom. inval.)]
MTTDAEAQALAVLRLFYRTSQSLKAKCDSHLQSKTNALPVASSSRPQVDGQAYNLQPPPPISRHLVELGLPQKHAEQLSADYLSSSEAIRKSSQKVLREACENIFSLPHHEDASSRRQRLVDGLVTAHTKQYHTELRRLEQGVYSIVPRLRQALLDFETSKKQDFNYDYIPCLEAFFEHNSRPTKADQDVMAKKSGMTRRQIQVWFQNHRRRAKKPLRTMQPDDRAADVDLSDMERKLGGVYVVPPQFRQEAEYDDFFASSDDQDEEDYDDDDEAFSTPEPDGPLDLMRPLGRPQSLPKFAELCNSQKRLTFPAPQWPRKASTSPPSGSSIMPEELARHFGRLNVRDSATSAEGRFTIPTATALPCSPLPALLPDFWEHLLPAQTTAKGRHAAMSVSELEPYGCVSQENADFEDAILGVVHQLAQIISGATDAGDCRI